MQEKSNCRDPNMVSSGVIRNFRSVVVPPSRQARQLPMHSLAVSGAAKRREYELSTVVMSRVVIQNFLGRKASTQPLSALIT